MRAEHEGPEREHRSHASARSDLETHARDEIESHTRYLDRGPMPAVADRDHHEPQPLTASERAYERTRSSLIEGDIWFEKLAHDFAYKDELSARDHAWLRRQGVRLLQTKKGRHGFSMMLFAPLPGFYDKRRPVLAFRGTSSLRDLLEDLHEEGLGAAQMAMNEGTIAKALRILQPFGKEPAVTGHSLGGALAQMTAARFPDLVAKVVTFQSPGIPLEMVRRVQAANHASLRAGHGVTVHSHHYRARHDLVTELGEAFTPGTVSLVDRDIPGLGHRHRIANDIDDAEHEEVHEREPGKLEWARQRLGGGIEAAQNLLGIGTGPREYLEVWNRVRHALDAGLDEVKVLEIVIESDLSKRNKQHMRKQLREVLLANRAGDEATTSQRERSSGR